MSKVIRLYRCCTERDRDNGFRLSSKMGKDLGSQAVEEIVSHELNSTTGRGVFYSFSTRISAVEYWRSEKNPSGNIMYVNIDLDIIPDSIVSLQPVFNRGYLMSLIAINEQILKDGYVINPATGRKHTVLGVLNYSQRSIAGWACTMSECVLQCKDLELNELSKLEDETAEITAEQTEALLSEKYMRTLKIQSVNSLRNLLQKQYTQANVSRRSLLNLANETGWYKAA